MRPAPKKPCALACDSRRGRQVAPDCTPRRRRRFDRCVVPPSGLARAGCAVHPRFTPSSTGAAGGPCVCQPDQQRHRQLHRSPHACLLSGRHRTAGRRRPLPPLLLRMQPAANPARMHSCSERPLSVSPCFAVAMPMAVRTLGVGVAVGAMLVQVRRCGWPSVGRAEWYAESQAEASRPTAATQCACLKQAYGCYTMCLPLRTVGACLPCPSFRRPALVILLRLQGTLGVIANHILSRCVAATYQHCPCGFDCERNNVSALIARLPCHCCCRHRCCACLLPRHRGRARPNSAAD